MYSPSDRRSKSVIFGNAFWTASKKCRTGSRAVGISSLLWMYVETPKSSHNEEYEFIDGSSRPGVSCVRRPGGGSGRSGQCYCSIRTVPLQGRQETRPAGLDAGGPVPRCCAG